MTLDYVSKILHQEVSVFDAFNITWVFIASLLLKSYFAVFIYVTWICPSLMIGQKLKFSRGGEILDTSIELSYDSLSVTTTNELNNNRLHFIALTELKNRFLRKDATKEIAT